MDRSRLRKSTLGFGNRGLVPVRLDMSVYTSRLKSPLGTVRGGLTPSPNYPSRTTQCLRSRRRTGITPVRPVDMSSRDASILFSIPKSSKPPKTPKSASKTRRCLYQEVPGNQACSGRKSVAPSKPAVRRLRSPTVKVAPEKSRLPKPASAKKAKCVTRTATVNSSQRSSGSQKLVNTRRKTFLPPSKVPSDASKPSTSGYTKDQAEIYGEQQKVLEQQQEVLKEQRTVLQEQQKVLQEINLIKSSVEEQKSMLLEAKAAFSQILLDQRCILEEQKKILEDARRSSLSDHEFTSIERALCKSSEDVNTVENLVNCSQSVSEAAYKQMRRSFKCLGTPTLTHSNKKNRTPKIKTPRTTLSNKVRAQLHSLLDE